MEEEPQIIENPPEPTNFTCKALVYVVVALLYGFPFILAIFGWIRYDLFIAFCFLCFGYLANGVIHSKIRQTSVPLDQRETSFSSLEISKWFVARYLLCK